MLRLSVEIEDANDLIADLQQVLVASISRSVSGVTHSVMHTCNLVEPA
ncbi:MAG: hypothetical protein N6V49_00175 [Serratia symbiotica]|nr:hypothetical protein [Serratia symbiotica]